MPHAAIDTGSVTTTSTVVKSSPSWVPDYTFTANGSEILTYMWRQEPESVSNPVRPDGTRAPSPYWARRAYISNSYATCESGVSTVTYWFCREGSPHPRLARFGVNPSLADIVNWFVHPVGFDVENRAKTKFLLKLLDEKGANKVDLGVAAGEFRETVDMAVDLFKGMMGGVKNIARKIERSPESVDSFLKRASKIGVENALVEVGKKKGAAESRLFEHVINGWLTVQLGLKPLAHDIYDATVWLKAAQMPDTTLPITIRVKGGAYGEYEYSKVLCEQGLNGAWVTLECDIVQSVKIDYSCVYKVPTNAGYATQLGVDNPGSVLWNLLLYSWLVDYAFGVGDWLSSMTAANGTSFLEGTMSKKRIARVDKLRSIDVLNSGITKDPAKAPLLVNIELFERSVLSSGVTPAAMPGVKKSLSLDKLANVLSVAKNFFR